MFKLSIASVDKLVSFGGLALSVVASVLSTKSQNRKIEAEVQRRVNEALNR